MYILKAMPYICAGYVSCGMCNDTLPGFMTEHAGEILISEKHLQDNIENIETAIKDCPQSALQLSTAP